MAKHLRKVEKKLARRIRGYNEIKNHDDPTKTHKPGSMNLKKN